MKWEGVAIVPPAHAVALQQADRGWNPFTTVEVLNSQDGSNAAEVYMYGRDLSDPPTCDGTFRANGTLDDREKKVTEGLDEGNVVVQVTVHGLTVAATRRRRCTLLGRAAALWRNNQAV